MFSRTLRSCKLSETLDRRDAVLKRHLFILASIVIGNSLATAAPAVETKYLLAHQETDPRFLTSIERIGPCKVSAPLVTGIRIPWQLYPQESVANHEEGS